MRAKSMHLSTSIEPLESRIAPALLVNGANLLGGDSPNSGETSVGDNSVTLVKVLSGQALVWFDGVNITSISVGPGAKLEITGNVLGDVIANLTAEGQLTDSDGDATNGEDGGILLANDILGIKTRPFGGQKGDVPRIITGGSVSGINITGESFGIYAGDGVFRAESFAQSGGVVESFVGNGLDINPVEPGVQSTFSFVDTAAQRGVLKPGASIAGVKLAEVSQFQLFAGNGSPTSAVATGTGVAGGSISNVTITAASVPLNAPIGTPSYHLITGDGQVGKKGGAGGTINSIIEASSSGPVLLTAGDGALGNAGAGGEGGSIVNLDLQSAGSQYNVIAGDGGAGTPGGAGGRLVNNNFSNRTPTTGVIISADFTGDGIDDILVADPGTGQMVLNRNVGSGDDFVQVVQEPGDVIIDAAGVAPVDGLARDMDGDTDLDVVILYNDGTVAIYLNRGETVDGANDGGVFYNPLLNGGTGGFEIRSFNLGYRPTKITPVSASGDTFMIAENTEGQGVLHALSMSVSGGDLALFVFSDVRKLPLPIIDIEGPYAATSDGTIYQIQFTVDEESAFAKLKTLPAALIGGITDIELDDNRTHLLALSAGGFQFAVYDLTQEPEAPFVVFLDPTAGTPLRAKFIHQDGAPDNVVLLTALENGASFMNFVAIPDGTSPIGFVYDQNAQFDSTTLLKNFVVVYGPDDVEPDLAAIAGPLNSFTLVEEFASENVFALPFASKQVSLIAGNGGFGIDLGAKLGKGGAGGVVTGTNVDAQIISITAGSGGDSTNGAAGAGGSISNSITPSPALPGLPAGSYKTAGGSIVTPKLLAESDISLTAGIGGMPTGAGGKSAAGGAGGDLFGLNITLKEGDIMLAAGAGGVGKGGVGGAGGGVKNVRTLAQGGSLTVFGGIGGAGTGPTGNGGAGGTILNLNYELALDVDAEKIEIPYAVTLTAGAGGASTGAIGGAGGDVSTVSLKLDGADRTFDSTNPPQMDAHLDSTITITVTAGNGANGVTGGGGGGSIRSFVSNTVHDQVEGSGVYLNYVVMGLFAGNGGTATGGNGGAGGLIALSKAISGITFFDPDQAGYNPSIPALIAVGGIGGEGSAKGGVGGGVSGLIAQNSPSSFGESLNATHLFSAAIIGGAGGKGGTGDGGAGGAIKDSLVGVFGGNFDVFGGNGGESTNAKGGAGGGITNSEFGLVNTFFALGLDVEAGAGGNGRTAGGAGGNLMGLRINTPQNPYNLSAFLVAGDGGSANLATGVGGKGGNVDGIAQAKDFNSTINLIQAGAGGDNLLGKGGAGGNVMNVRTVGFIGRPSDSVGTQLGVFDSSQAFVDDDNDSMTPDVIMQVFPTIAQGLFTGRGGNGTTDGINGSVSNITARQIAAIAAGPDLVTGLFAVVPKVTKVKTALIGFDADRDGVFDTTGAPGATPSGTRPIDGFILAAALSQVTGTRSAFSFTA